MARELEEVIADLKTGIKALREAQEDYEYAWAYYEGDDPELFLSDTVRGYLGEEVRAFRLNAAAIPVDSVVDRLIIKAITSTDAATQAEIDKILAENDVWMWSNDAMRDGEMYGDEYIGVWEGSDARPILSPLDPLSTRVVYDKELERIPDYMVRMWFEGDEHTGILRATISYPDMIFKFYKSRNGDDWTPYELDSEPWPLPNVLGDLPVGHIRNAMPYGAPGHRKSYGMQQMLTKGLLNMAINIDFMAFRQRYALKNPDSLSGPAAGLPAPQARVGDATSGAPLRPALTSGPGKLWNVVADAIGEFTPPSVDDFVTLVEFCFTNMARVERLPVRVFDDASGQQPSGASQRESERSFRHRIDSRRRSFGAAWVDAISKALKIVNPTRAWGEVSIEWDGDEVVTDTETIEAAKLVMELVGMVAANPALREIGLQKLRELGYSDEQCEMFLGFPESTEDAMIPETDIVEDVE